jgi:hypothetical protein
MNSPGSYQIIPMNVPADPHGASSLPEKRLNAGTYFSFATPQPLTCIENLQPFLLGIQTSLPVLLPFAF